MRAINLAQAIVRCFPNEALTAEELHNFTILLVDFKPGDDGHCGHFTLFEFMSFADLHQWHDSLKDLVLSVAHWDSISTWLRLIIC